MLDDFRQQASQSPFYEEEPHETFVEVKPKRPPQQRFLGMTAGQRFVLALLVLMMVCFLGALFLVVTEKVVLPLF